MLRFSGGYGFSVIIGAILSIAVIPAVIIVAGSDVWAAIAVAQAVGGFGFVLVAAGWGVTGPTSVASLPAEERGAFYIGSLITRSWLLVLILGPAVFVAISLTGHHPLISGVTTATSLLSALSAGWFFVGEASPIRFLLLETLPRNLGTAIGAAALLATGDPVWFVVLQGLGALAATAIASANIMSRYRGWAIRLSPVRAFARLRGQASAISMAATASVYVNFPIVVVQMFIPEATALYALAERIMRLALYSTRPLVQVSQGYVPSPSPVEQVSRARRVMKISGLLGLLGGLAYALGSPLASSILSGNTLSIPLGLAIPMGIALSAMLISQVTGFACLTAFGLTRVLATSTVAGAIVGALLLVPLALAFGVIGLASALAASEVVVLVVQLIRLRQVVGDGNRAGAPGPALSPGESGGPSAGQAPSGAR